MSPIIFSFILALQSCFNFDITNAKKINNIGKKVNISLLFPYDSPNIQVPENIVKRIENTRLEEIEFIHIYGEIMSILFYILIIDTCFRLFYKIIVFINKYEIKNIILSTSLSQNTIEYMVRFMWYIMGCYMHIKNTYNIYIYIPYSKIVKPILYEILELDDGRYEIIVVRNGKETHKFKTMNDFKKSGIMKRDENHENDITYPFNIDNYDFVMQTFYNKENDDTKNYCIKYDYFNEGDYNNTSKTFDLPNIVSNNKFIAVVLKFNNKEYQINIYEPFNFNVSENVVLEYNFLKWYMRKYYNIKLTNEYTICAIDNGVQLYHLYPSDAIEVCKNKYNKFEYTFDFNNDDNSDSSTDSGYTIYNDEEREGIIEDCQEEEQEQEGAEDQDEEEEEEEGNEGAEEEEKDEKEEDHEIQNDNITENEKNEDVEIISASE
jgi:hypothetical protein